MSVRRKAQAARFYLLIFGGRLWRPTLKGINVSRLGIEDQALHQVLFACDVNGSSTKSCKEKDQQDKGGR